VTDPVVVILFRYVTSHPGRLSLLPSAERYNEYQPNGGDALQLDTKGGYAFAGKTVCCHLSALANAFWYLWRLMNIQVYFTFTLVA